MSDRKCSDCSAREWLFQPRRPGAPSRAEEIDAYMEGVRARRYVGRVILWAAGMLAAGGTIIEHLRGLVGR